MSKTMTFAESIDALDRANADERILDRRTGRCGRISKAVRDGLISSVRVALRAATGRSDVDDVDLLSLAESLPDHALADALEAGHANPSNAADRVRRFLSIVGPASSRGGYGADYPLPEGWRPLYASAWQLGYNYASRLRALYRAATGPQPDRSAPLLDPADLPDRETVRCWLVAAGHRKREPGEIIRSYQRARDAMSDSDRIRLPSLAEVTEHRGRSLRCLPHAHELLADSGVSLEEFMRLPAMRRIEVVAPHIHYGVVAYLHENAHLSRHWRKKAISGVERMLAAMEAAGLPLATYDPMDLYTMTIEVTSSAIAKPENPLLARRYGASGGSEAAKAQYLMRRVVDVAARQSLDASPLTLVTPDVDGQIGHYTATVQHDLGHFYEMARVAYAAAREINPAEWTAMEVVQRELVVHMQQTNSRAQVAGQKKKEELLELVTLPQTVCIGLPRLRTHVLTLRRRYHAALCRHDIDRNAVIRARISYGRMLRKYLILALMLSDGLRVGNYTGARLGVHILPRLLLDDSGRPIGLDGVGTYWRGFDEASVKLKMQRDELGAERTRRWHVLPGIVDLELLYEYLVDIRVETLHQCGLIPAARDYDLHKDIESWHFALFPSPHTTAHQRAGCHADTSSLSQTFGRALHWIVTEALGRELPAWGSDQLRCEYRALFSAHVSRLLVATYWGGIRSNWTRACMLTDDTEPTLRKSYSRVGALMIERMSRPGWTNPNHFDGEMDRIFSGEVIDWEPRSAPDADRADNRSHSTRGRRPRRKLPATDG